MVLLNNDILICKETMINSIKNLMQQVMEEYFYDENYYEKKENKKKYMKELIYEKISDIKSNHFWYINSSESVCTYIHKRGKKDGYMCHRKIKTNIGNNKPDYLCSIHSKLHIPKKRNINVKNDILEIKTNEYVQDIKTFSIFEKSKKIKKNKKNQKNKKIYICNGGLLDLGKIISSILD